jgi:hypothetical protein
MGGSWPWSHCLNVIEDAFGLHSPDLIVTCIQPDVDAPGKPRIEPFLTVPTQAARWQPHYSNAGSMVHIYNSMS